MTTYSVVIPVYKSANCLPELANQLKKVFEELKNDYEIIMVDDCSPDESWSVITEIARTHPHFKGVQLLKNSGQTRATMTGIRIAKGDVVITMDDDLQHDPQLIPHLLEEMEKDGGYDGVFAYFPKKKHATYRNVGSKLIRWINAHAFGVKELKISSFRLMRRYLADIVRQNHSASATVGGLMLANASKIKYVPIQHNKRFSGKSNYTLGKQIKMAFDNICSVSMLPLRMISATGLIAATLSGFLICFFLFEYFTGGITLPGWTSQMILTAFFSGLILLSLGVIGEYLVRVLRELQSTSVTAIRKTVGFPENESMISISNADLSDNKNNIPQRD
ncbi:glycosyltransferase family 2 protein [Methylotuvimicrobium alcaliphilum]|uniref:Uncharacterized glycosyltransferase ykcC n=1 Tax=Methylotuvimicrobium alcaliphilum (strain DSM 19304 / NCIMB 14124 / VKM B-2133 / 20Z) TaxID=1091494 RepID=G4SYX0_META2|nr:glycosyltransferase family 2 protein [Methylotuvimicrobium alcaliphilum]CCE24416.1 putative Uncharacterized glycosyltransferase ykcC [Methylotuvimicrobium alcaliphilum 20Z]